MTPTQLKEVARLLLPAMAGVPSPPPRAPQPSPRDLEIKKLRQALADSRGLLDECLSACHGCGLNKKAHAAQKGYGMGYHDFEPLSPDAMIKVIRAHKSKVAKMERDLAALVNP